MKRTITILTLSVFCWFDGSVPGAVNQPKDPVPAIRRQYTAINKRARTYRKVRKELSGFSLEGGELIAYFNGPAIPKIVVNHFGEGGRSVEEYYYSDGQLIFVLERVLSYDRPLSGKVVKIAENRFYFHDERLVRWIDETGKVSPAGVDQYQLKQSENLTHSKQFVEAARSKNRTIESVN